MKSLKKLKKNSTSVITIKRYKCLLCGRDKFTEKTPHKCVGGFRKRKIKWEEIKKMEEKLIEFSTAELAKTV